VRKKEGACRVWVGTPNEKDHLERPRCRWDYKNEIGLQKLGCELALAQNRNRERAALKEVVNCLCP
jgi:hypothetical protein